MLERQTAASEASPGTCQAHCRGTTGIEQLAKRDFLVPQPYQPNSSQVLQRQQQPFPCKAAPEAAGEQVGWVALGGFACSSLSVVNWCF